MPLPLPEADSDRVPGLSVIVLCGGLSTRMGSNKAELLFQGETFLDRVIQAALQAAAPLIVVGQVDRTRHRHLEGIEIIPDRQRNLGPLEGIRTGLAALADSAPMAFVTSCDVPLLQPALIRHLAQRLGDHDAVVPVSGSRRYGMTAIYRTAAHQVAERRIRENQLRVSDLGSALNTCWVPRDELAIDDPDLSSFTNINTLEDYRRLMADHHLAIPASIEDRIRGCDRGDG